MRQVLRMNGAPGQLWRVNEEREKADPSPFGFAQGQDDNSKRATAKIPAPSVQSAWTLALCGVADGACGWSWGGFGRFGFGWFWWVGGALVLQDQCAVGAAEGDSFFGEGQQDAAAEFAEDAVALVDHDPDVDGIEDFVAADLIDAGDVGVGHDDVLESFVFADLHGEVFEDFDDAVGIFAGID